MNECLKMDSLISFAGPLTFKNARHAPECVQTCPLDRLLTETDSPYLTPVPHRGKQNEPMYVKYVAQKVAEIKGLPKKRFVYKSRKISYRFFRSNPNIRSFYSHI